MAAPPPGARKVHSQGGTFYVLGDLRLGWRDLYHTFLRMRWSATLGLVALYFLVANLAFAGIYRCTGGVENVHSFFDAVSFSVQTMATVGYGAMYPSGTAATVVMIAESFIGLLWTALLTGLVFAKFSRPSTRITFAKHAVVARHEGIPTLQIRLGNRRGNVIVEANAHVSIVITTQTQEHNLFYKAVDLKLIRDRHVGLSRGWNLMHVIDETSPLWGMDQAGAQKAELEIWVAITGIDDTSRQTVNTTHQYMDGDVKWGMRFADTIVPLDNGEYMIDLTKFDDVVPDVPRRAAST
ncbi:MAG TPA: ion channel [Kofleriaceae bacterium]|jgi:inward rectifier potassium channel